MAHVLLLHLNLYTRPVTPLNFLSARKKCPNSVGAEYGPLQFSKRACSTDSELKIAAFFKAHLQKEKKSDFVIDLVKRNSNKRILVNRSFTVL